MALYLVNQIAGATTAQIIQLAIEYDPQPPFSAGSPDKALRAMVMVMVKRLKL